MRNKRNIPKIFLVLVLSSAVFGGCKETVKVEPEEEKEVKPLSMSETEIYTTAHGTDLKLSQTGTVSFNEFKQPLETEASILVNKDRLHQDFCWYWCGPNRCFCRNFL